MADIEPGVTCLCPTESTTVVVCLFGKYLSSSAETSTVSVPNRRRQFSVPRMYAAVLQVLQGGSGEGGGGGTIIMLCSPSSLGICISGVSAKNETQRPRGFSFAALAIVVGQLATFCHTPGNLLR